MESDHSQFISWSIDLYHLFPLLKSVVLNDTAFVAMLNHHVSKSNEELINLDKMRKWTKVLETCYWKYIFLNLTYEIPPLQNVVNFIMYMKSKTIDISIVMILRAKLMKMESEEWRNSLKTYCYSSRIAKLVPDPEKLWKMMTGEYKEEVKVPKERVKTNSKTLLNMEPNFKAFHGNKEHRNEIEFKFKQLIKYSMFMEPPYKLYKIQTDINLAYKISGYIYGQEYLTNKDINSLYGFNTKNPEYQSRINSIIEEALQLRSEQWKSGKWKTLEELKMEEEKYELEKFNPPGKEEKGMKEDRLKTQMKLRKRKLNEELLNRRRMWHNQRKMEQMKKKKKRSRGKVKMNSRTQR